MKTQTCNFIVSINYTIAHENNHFYAKAMADNLKAGLTHLVNTSRVDEAFTFDATDLVDVIPTGIVYNHSQMDCALCVFDQLLDVTQWGVERNDIPLFDYVMQVKENGGTPALRQMAIELSVLIQAAFSDIDEDLLNEYAQPFDFEFIPNLLMHAVESEGSLELNDKVWARLALEVVNTAISIADTTDIIEKQYRVEWCIDIDATSAEEAAKKALRYQRDTESTATVFEVCEVRNGDTISRTEIDLLDELTPQSDASETWEQADLDAALTASGIELPPIADSAIQEASEADLTQIYTKDTGRQLITVSRGELLALASQSTNYIKTAKGDKNGDKIARLQQLLVSIDNILQVGTFASENDFTEVDFYIGIFGDGNPSEANATKPVEPSKGDAVKQDEAARNNKIALHAAQAAEAIAAMLDAGADCFVQKIYYACDDKANGDYIFNEVKTDLLLIAQTFSGK